MSAPYVNLLDPEWYVEPFEANRWLRDQLSTVFAEDPAITLPPPYGRDGQLYASSE